MGLIKYTTAFVMLALFSIALISFAINFSIDNRAAVNIGDDSDFSTLNTGLQSDVDSFYENASIASESFQQSTISSQTESSEGGTQFKVTPGNSLSMATKALRIAFGKLLGFDSSFSIVFTALIALIIFIIGLYAWKAWKGVPD